MILFAVLNSLVSDVKKGSLRVNSVMVLVVLSTHAELASGTLRGRSYWETGELHFYRQKISKLHKKRDNFACDIYIFPKTKANKKKQWTHLGALNI